MPTEERRKLSPKEIHLVSDSEDISKVSLDAMEKEAGKLDKETQDLVSKALQATFEKKFSKGVNNGVGSWDSSNLRKVTSDKASPTKE